MKKFRLFCFGFGYSARALAAIVQAEGWRIAGTVRAETDAEELEARGYDIFRFDGAAPMADAASALAGTTHLLSSVPPAPEGDSVLLRHTADIEAIQGLDWIGYLSTTGVYGDRDGGRVDENSSLEPTGERGRRRVAAEEGWHNLRTGVGLHLFRLAGIYGPGRSALDTVRSGSALRIVKPGQVFSRIHVDDIARILRASIKRPNAVGAFNVCDDEAAPPQDVIAYACELLGIEAPPEIAIQEAGLSDMAKSFYQDNKRVSNQRIKDKLGVVLKWPNYRVGLRGLIE
jgi:nucleoside-diphosphate-sugar epimerase